jgi:hypothetical protein
LFDPFLLTQSAGRQSATSGKDESPRGTITACESRAVAEDGAGSQAVKSIALILQVQGPGNERHAVYAFNALVEDSHSQ